MKAFLCPFQSSKIYSKKLSKTFKDFFIKAMELETNTLKIHINNYTPSIKDTIDERVNQDKSMDYQTQVEFQKHLLSNTLKIYFKVDSKYVEKYTYKENPKLVSFDASIYKHNKDFSFSSYEQKAKKLEDKGAYILIITRNIAFKYKVFI